MSKQMFRWPLFPGGPILCHVLLEEGLSLFAVDEQHGAGMVAAVPFGPAEERPRRWKIGSTPAPFGLGEPRGQIAEREQAVAALLMEFRWDGGHGLHGRDLVGPGSAAVGQRLREPVGIEAGGRVRVGHGRRVCFVDSRQTREAADSNRFPIRRGVYMRGFLMTCLILTAAAAVRAEELKIAAGEQIVAIGDSITQAGGYLRDIDMVFATQYPDLKIPKVINTGISGQKAEDLVGRFGRDVVARKPALVTIDIGINDVWHRLGQPHNDEVLRRYKENLERMVDAAQGAGIRVVLCTPTVIQEDPNSEGNKRLKLYCDVVRQIAADKKCLLADLHAGFIDTLAKKTGNGNQLTSDGVHMNGVGDWLMAEVIVGALGVPKEKVEAAKTAR
ncbi:MAG: hypothetical protein EBR23_05715 [Planctomycetia bacterium]|nr:hypothetical protein [Planctomycetia bacterium]